MQIDLEINPTKYQIRSCAPGCILINDQEFSQPLIITPNFLGEFNQQNFLQACTGDPEIFLIGLRDKISFAPQLMRYGIEVMTTAAACRTYTLLSSEYRNVLALLQP